MRSSDLVIFTFSISLVCALYLLTLMLNYFEEVKKKKKLYNFAIIRSNDSIYRDKYLLDSTPRGGALPMRFWMNYLGMVNP